MRFEEFIVWYFSALEANDVTFCVLRNHAELPARNVGRDIDLLVRPGDLATATRLLVEQTDISITAVTERASVRSLFVDGVLQENGNRAVEIDLLTDLAWKGLSYLDPADVLDGRDIRRSPDVGIPSPRPAHEAIVSFFSSYLVGGWIQQRYQGEVRAAFEAHADETVGALAAKLPGRLAAALVRAVVSGDEPQMMLIRPRIRNSLVIQSITKRPIASLGRLVRHFWREAVIRHTGACIDDIVFLGPDGAGKSSVIEAVAAELDQSAKDISIHHLRPRIFFGGSGQSTVDDPHALPPRSAIVSAGKITMWVIEYLLARLNNRSRFSTIRLWDRYFHDILIDPRRYRYGAPAFVAKCIGALVPSPRLWVILNAPTEVLRQRKTEVPEEETDRQRLAYLDFAEKNRDAVVIDAGQSLEKVVAQVRSAIVDRLSQSTEQHFVR